ncbi:ATPase, F1/V1/A1 complex, alpha/beta subunit, partial [Tanacetum coccineum]
MSTTRRSKRKPKIPLKFGDSVCDLIGKKNNKENNADCDSNDEIWGKCARKYHGNHGGNDGGKDGGFKGDTDKEEEGNEVMELVNEFLMIQESLNCKVNVSESNSGYSSPKIHNMPDEIKSHEKQNSNITEPKSHKLNEGGVLRKSFISTVAENIVDNKLKLIPTGMNDGREVGKFGLIDIVTQNDMFLIKFRDEVGMNHVLENGPWMVNNKPMFIQKWDTSIIMDRKEPKALPLWVKLHFVPIEAWTVNGISAIASSLGKPLIMDKTTTKMCNEGRGRFGYARVLIEVQAKKEFKEKVEICYSSNQNPEGNFSKYVDVEYSWKPPVCTLCKVFGHLDRNYGKVHNGKKPNFGRTGEMFKYFKEQWEDKWENGFMDVEDVNEEENGMSKDVLENVLN